MSAVLVTVVALVGLLVAGRWLQPRLDREAPATPPAPSRPTVVTTTRPPDSPGITKTADSALVDAIAVTTGSVWIAAGGLVVRVDRGTRRKVVVRGGAVDEPPVVRLAAGAGAVWAATTAGRQLLRIDPRTARVTASLPVPAEAVSADGSGVWAVCCGFGARRGQLTRVDPASGLAHDDSRVRSARVGASLPKPDRARGRVWDAFLKAE